MTIMEEILTETLFKGDLRKMVLNTISFDEYNSKISKTKAMVLGYWVKNEQAAIDFAMFSDRSPINEIMDAEVSPSVDENGNYMVFLEIDINISPKSLLHLLHIQSYLVANDGKWLLKPYKLEKEVPPTIKNLSILLNRIKKLRQEIEG